MALIDRHARPVELTPESGRFLYKLRKGLFFVQRAFQIKTRTRADSAVIEVGHSAYFDGDLLIYLTHVGKTLKLASRRPITAASRWKAALLAEQRVGVALATRATARCAQNRAIVFRPFAEQQLAIEIQLIVRPGPKPPALLAFVHVIERMKERIERKT